jgi:P27 family predicted phage terminase small subunit
MPRPALTPIEEYLRGTKSRAAADAGTATTGRAIKPAHLSPEAQQVWKRVSKLLGARHTQTPGDWTALALFCEVYVRWVQAKKELGTELMIDDPVLDSNGQLHTRRKLNPLLKVVEAAEKNLLVMARELGLTPLMREKVKPAKEPESETAGPATVGDALRGHHE